MRDRCNRFSIINIGTWEELVRSRKRYVTRNIFVVYIRVVTMVTVVTTIVTLTGGGGQIPVRSLVYTA